jgi:aspartyl-tRNA(Asn)/glutamyl-tRNA(Gln) amidotransferase subunit A
MSDDLAALPVHELAPLLESRKVSPVEVTEAVLGNVARHDDTLKAYIDVYRDDALRAARDAESEISGGRYRGPLHGVPLAIKDNIYFADRVTTMGSKIHGSFVSSTDASVVERLSGAGAVFIGKLNMHEYALGGTTDNRYYGTCRNPWDLDKSPGGSSGGSAAALASNMASAALGSDTSGSIRIPAAFCGIVGLKPTYGRVSRFGCFPEAWTLDHVGPMTRSVKDAAIMLDAISGYDPRDPGSLDLPATSTAGSLRTTCEGMTIGVVEEFYFSDVDDEIARCVRAGIEALREQGAEVRTISIPGLKDCEYALTIIDTSETSTVHRANLRDRPQDYGDDVRLLLECGELPSAVDYLEAQQIRRHLRAEVQAAFAEVDVIAGPTVPIRTPTIGEATATINGRDVDALENLIRLVGPGSLLGLPSLSMPCGLVDGMPVGMQIIGPARGEQSVLDVAHAFESTAPLGSHQATAYLEA